MKDWKKIVGEHSVTPVAGLLELQFPGLANHFQRENPQMKQKKRKRNLRSQKRRLNDPSHHQTIHQRVKTLRVPTSPGYAGKGEYSSNIS